MIETANGPRPRRIKPPASARCFTCRRRFGDSVGMRFTYDNAGKPLSAYCTRCATQAAGSAGSRQATLREAELQLKKLDLLALAASR